METRADEFVTQAREHLAFSNSFCFHWKSPMRARGRPRADRRLPEACPFTQG